MPPKENHTTIGTEQWLRYAYSDLEIAGITPSPNMLLEGLCFHAQQAAEKSIKAVLIDRGVSFPRTHNIRTLLELIPPDISIPEEIQEAASLTDYAVSSRYPSDLELIGEDEHQKAIHSAKRVVSWAENIVQLQKKD